MIITMIGDDNDHDDKNNTMRMICDSDGDDKYDDDDRQ